MTEEGGGKLKLRIPGYEVPEARKPPELEGFKVTEARSIRVSGAERGEDKGTELDTDADDVFEIELEDGTRLWTSSQRLVDEVLKLQRPRAAGEVIVVPPDLQLKGPSRGLIGKLAIKVFRWFRIDIPELAAKKLAKVWEDRTLGVKRDAGPGLYRVGTGPTFDLRRLAEKERLEPSDQPLLLFLHGTASSTAGSFGELWVPERRQILEQLLAPYQGRTVALEHRTLTESPVENAIQVLEGLPSGARLHLVSHSRGGLVGELLCRAGVAGGRAPFDGEDFRLFPEGDAPGHRQNLQMLNELLRSRRPQVERFVRVACPARGTTLASERLDIYLSLVLNLLQKVPFLKITTDILAELIMAIAKERSDPKVLPGLEAQVPGSPLVRILNRPDREVGGELRVITGDLEGESALSLLSTVLTDPLYQGDHDLVVDTLAMYGGAERLGGAAFSFHRGSNVNHFRYFRNEDSAAKLPRALARKVGEEDGFAPFSVRQSDEGLPPYQRGEGPPRPVVLLLPGIMGSHLAIGDDRIWLDIGDLAFGGLARLHIGETAVLAGPPLSLAYERLLRVLAVTHDVEPFPYDWRLSIGTEAARLAQRIEERLEEAERHGLPVSIIGHSLGGLVARAMVALHPATWERMGRHPDSRLLMLGTPNGGSHDIARALVGRDSLIKKLALLDFKNSKRTLLGVINRFPGVLELLPGSGSIDLFQIAGWEQIAASDQDADEWPLPSQAALAEAKSVRESIAGAVDPARMLYVAGWAAATPVDVTIEDALFRGKRVVFHATPEGDGRVPWSTGRLPGVKTWYMHAVHGDLADHEPGFEAIRELLVKGSTELLSTSPPAIRGAPDRFEMPEERAPLFPNAEDLARAALGAGRPSPARKVYPRARVKVLHGNLAYAQYPVLVGHYAGDTIVSAEAYLDRALEGRLQARAELGLYPGPRDTEEVFLNPKGKPAGAIVVGLGQVGELSPGRLMRATTRGARKLVLAIKECDPTKGARPDSNDAMGITALLVGSGAGGLPVDECVTQILRGVADANRALTDSEALRGVWIREVELIELFEDRAIQAAHALRRVRHDRELATFFEIDALPCVESRRGGRRRASLAEEDPWWQRLQITEDRQGRLTFNRLTDRARSEVSLLPTQRVLVDDFIDDATETTSTDQRVAVTLFEMLVPNELKAQAPDRRSLVLVLDEESARFPWELMQERQRDAGGATGTAPKPLSVEAGVIRQLGAEQFRLQPMMARGRSALVVGNPPTSTFSSLAGAEAEAVTVAGVLGDQGFQVALLLGNEERAKRAGGTPARAKEILHALYQRDYRIVHLAGHGVYEYPLEDKARRCEACGQESKGNTITGMVLSDREFLTPALIEQMQAVPELVFINCCYLGKIEKERRQWHSKPSRLAANLATQLIQMGVKAVVAAGWAVDDAAAETFARVFYQQILSGAPFGEAVKSARRTCFEDYPGVNTWGAYQCYGDPAYSLAKGEGGRRPPHEPRSLLSRAECLIDLYNIAEEAGTAVDAGLTMLLERLTGLDRELPAAWRSSAELIAALGRAYGELGQFEKAVECYSNALSCNDATLPVKAVEQLCNLEARLALSALRGDPKEAEAALERASTRLEGLITHCGLTAERRGLRGSIAKRRAILAPDLASKLEALVVMSEAYHEQRGPKGTPAAEVDPYTLFNALAADVLICLLKEQPSKPKKLMDHLKLAKDAAADNDRKDPSFWNAVVKPDCMLLEGLAKRQLDEEARGEILAAYLHARHRAASPREFRSVLEQIDFYLEVLAVAPAAVVSGELVEALKWLRAQVAA